MDDTGHAITRDQIADKTVEITFTTHGHSEGYDPDDNGEDHIVHTNIFLYPYTESFKKEVPRESKSYIGYDPYDWTQMCGCYEIRQYRKVELTDRKYPSMYHRSFNIFNSRSDFMNSVAKDVINYYKNGGIDKYVSQVATAKRAADAYANQIVYCYEHNQKYNGKYVDYYDMKGAKELAEDYYYELEDVKKAQANKTKYVSILQQYVNWSWPAKIEYDHEMVSPSPYNLYYKYHHDVTTAFQNALVYVFSTGGGRDNSWGTSPYNMTLKVNGAKQSAPTFRYWFYYSGSSDEPQGYSFLRVSNVSHTHNSNGIDYNQGNDNQHIKYTYCNSHGSDHSQNRSSGTWQNHTWVHSDVRTDKCSVCGKTRTRHYYDPSRSNDNDDYVNVSVMSPTGREDQESGYFQLSRDGVNWSSETTDQIMSYVRSFKYNDKLYVRYTRPYYDYYELDSVTYELPMTKINDNTWCYTVQSESPRQWIRINMKYKPFDVHYILSGGSLSNKKESYIITDTFTIGQPSLSGYTFTGWTMTCSKGKANDRSFIPCNILVPTKDVTISNMYGDITLTANYEKSGTNDDNGHNKTPDDDGLPEHITDTGDRKTPLVTDGNTKHNMFRVTK